MAAQAALTLKRDVYPHDVLFHEQDDILWLRGQDLVKAKQVVGFCNEGQDSIGFDAETAGYYIRELLQLGLSVGIVRGSSVQTLTLPEQHIPAKVPSKTVWVAPVLLYGQTEMERLAKRLVRQHSPMAGVVERFRQELSKGNERAINEVGDLYIYQVGSEMYEPDLELTAIPETLVEALAVAAHLEGCKLRCRLVEPKARRGRKANAGKSKIVVSGPVTYGQLRFVL